MKKIAVITLGWHFGYHFYKNIPKQNVPSGWEIDYFCIAHRSPTDNNTINDKKSIREEEADNFLVELDKELYKKPITEDDINDFGWKYILNEVDWLYLENGYSEHIPKAFTPRTSFSIYKKEFFDMLPNNKFDMTDNGKEIMTRVGKTDTPDSHEGLAEWNVMVGTLRDWLYNDKPDLGMLNHYGWLSNSALRVSKYCIEGERGFIQKHSADCGKYIEALTHTLKNLNLI